MRDQRDVGILMDGHHPIMVLETADERLAMLFLSRLARQRSLPLYQWAQTSGIQLVGEQLSDTSFFPAGQAREPMDVLTHIKSSPHSGCFVLCDIHPFLKDSFTVRLLKDIVLQDNLQAHKLIVLMSHEITLPGELKYYSTHFALTFPNERKLLGIIIQELKHWTATNRGARSYWDINDMQSIARSLEGYSVQDARVWIKNALHREQVAQSGSSKTTAEVRKRLFSGTEALHFEFDLCTLSDVAGYAHYKNWLNRQKNSTQIPKSILLFGAEGCGKSKVATATSIALSLPILSLDVSVWQSLSAEESQIWLNSLKTLGTGVLWIDRIDVRTLSMPDAMRSKFKQFLKEAMRYFWLVATSGAQSMPFFELDLEPMFSDRFFVDMPHFEVRKDILATHLNARQINQNSLNLRELATHSEGLSGDQIEQAIVEAVHTAAAHNEMLDDSHILAEMSVEKPAFFNTYDYLESQRQWAEAHALTVD
jgi:hypothetical protein